MKSRWQIWVSLGGGLAVGLLTGYLVGLWYSSGTLHEYRNHLEVIYFVAAGPLVLLVLLAGLAQIVVSVREISKRSRREAATLAIATCEKFAREFIPLDTELMDTLRDAKLEVPDEWKFLNDLFRWESFADEDRARAWEKKLQISGFAIKATNVVNMLEGLAMAFIHGEADNAIGYHTIGAPFCYCVRRWAPHLVALKIEQSFAESGAFVATVNLYRIWEARRREAARSG